MNLYLLVRRDPVNWDEFKGFVIRASCLGRAIEIATEQGCAPKGIWEQAQVNVLAEEVEGDEEILLDSFCAG